MNDVAENYAWRPQAGPQTAFVHCPYEEIFFGGARGGGKTDGALGRSLFRALKYGAAYKGYFIRRELVQLEPAIARSKEVLSQFATYNEQKKSWRFRTGGTLTFRYIERDSDAEKFQGDSATDINVEEIGNFPDLRPLMKLKGILRSTRGVPVAFTATGNPGGPGHSLVKRRYIDPSPLGWVPITEEDELTGLKTQRVYIPSRITDNQLLMKNDPGYLARLAQTGSESLVKAWIDGDFSIVEGAYFNFSMKRHVLRTASLPPHWLYYRAMDWGSYYPFYVCWMAHASEDWVHPDGALVPKGSIIVFREWYGSKDHDNRGLKMPAGDVGRELRRIEGEMPYKITFGVLDPKQFSTDGGPSVAERIARGYGSVIFRRADNRRLGKDGAAIGWDAMRQRLDGVVLDAEMPNVKVPQLFFFDCCVDAIRTIPALQHDPDKPEDLMGSEDHPADAVRYGVMARPWIKPGERPKPDIKDAKDWTSQSLDQLWEIHERSKGREPEWRV